MVVAAAMRSSDPNFRQSADCRKLGSPAPKTFSRKRSIQKKQPFFLACLVTFTELEEVLTRCLSFRHFRDYCDVLQNYALRQYFLLGGGRDPENENKSEAGLVTLLF